MIQSRALIHICILHMMLCSEIFEKKGNTQVWITSSCGYVQIVPTIEWWINAWKSILGPINNEELSSEDRKKELEAVNLIKEKKHGNIKGMTCANGIQQKGYLKEYEYVYYPKCMTESLISTLLIYTMEHRDEAVFDVPGYYLQTEMPPDKWILLCIRDDFVDIMCEVNPDYKLYFQYDNGNKVLYVKVMRPIYVCIKSDLLWYNFCVKTLKYLGFSMNTYYRCMAKKIIDGKQCTIVWYVDDNKL